MTEEELEDQVLTYLITHPGATAYGIARDMGRYHRTWTGQLTVEYHPIQAVLVRLARTGRVREEIISRKAGPHTTARTWHPATDQTQPD